MNLSKAKYCTGMQCPKILWMDKNMPEQKAEQDDTRAKIGSIVGDLAMGYFGEHIEVPYDKDDYNGMITQTRRLLEASIVNIAEATFSVDGNFCMVDILRKTDTGYEIVEVKSASGTDEEEKNDVRETHLHDLAYQYYVVTGCGLNVEKVSLLRLNRNYVRQGNLSIRELFILRDCTETVLQMQDCVPDSIVAIKEIAAQESEPDIQISSGCIGCVYSGWCMRNLPEYNVFRIGHRMRRSKKDEAYQNGYISYEQVLCNGVMLNDKQRLEVETVVHNLPPHIERDNLRQFLNGLSYPLYHLDFETWQQAIPLWDNVKTYCQVPFQYSLHIQVAPCAEPEHREFLGKEGFDPRRELAERLCADIPKDACVLAYYAPFEKGRIKYLADLYPDLAEHLMCIHNNVKDLMDPFKNGHYYCREMGGSNSIKVVLPALCGDDLELDYNKLELVHHGAEAMAAYATLHEQPPEERGKIRMALLAYCKLDTLAMVKILERLYEIMKK